MSVHLARAEILLAQSRPADAEREARQALAANPHDASAHAFLALCCAQLGRHEDALMEARMAVGLAADEGAFHRVLGIRAAPCRPAAGGHEVGRRGAPPLPARRPCACA
jgi:Tfp pilus assembly protein PilF